MKQNTIPALIGATLLASLFFGLFPSETLFGKPPATKRPSDSWSFISKTTCTVDRFLNHHPTADGRGVIVVILDTGVDMGVAGLQKTSLGTRKVIDVQNFSGSGDVRLSHPISVKSDSGIVFQDTSKLVKLTGFERLGLKAKPDSYRIGVFDEKRMRNSDVYDLDGDGKSTTLFGILVCETEAGFIAIVDTDADGSLADERPLQSYKKHFDTFTFARKSKDKRPVMTCALNIFPEKNSVILHFDDGSHGTHVAGIAAGHNIFSENDEQTFDGIAPGAEIVSCKISDGAIGDLSTTGSIKAGFDYAAELSRSQSKPVVVNLSFGIPSVMEGLSDLERYLDTLIESHSNLYVCVSNGNEGPGLSTTGLPAASKRVISVGALNNKDIARESFGSLQEGNMIWNFSSRGGEVPKPDLVAPGSAHSTVPNFSSRTLSSGTSMASPYVAGSVAILLSALLQEDSAGVARHCYPQRVIKTALRASATPMPGYVELDCGTGILNVENAYNTLQSYSKSGFASKLIDYNTQTDSPNLGADMDGPAAFWRTVNFLQDKSTQNFKVTPVFTRDYSATDKEKFFRIYNLQSTAKWLKPLQKTMFIKGEKSGVVTAFYDKSLMKSPGLYVGRLVATPALSHNSGNISSQEVEFELLSTVIVPYQFSPEQKGKVVIENEKLNAGKIKRYFFAVPSGCSVLKIRTIAKNESGKNLSATIINHKGKIVGYVPTIMADELSSEDQVSENLESGIYEVVVEASGFSKPAPAAYSLEATLSSIEIKPVAQQPNLLRVSVCNSGSTPIFGLVRGEINGYEKRWSDTVFAGKVFRKPIIFGHNESAIELRFSVSAEDYNKNTDATILLLDSTGKKISSKALESLSEKAFILNPYEKRDSGAVFLEFHFGFALNNPNNFAEFSVTEFHRTSPTILGVSPSAFELIPFVSAEVEVKLPKLSEPPQGFHRVGSIHVDESKSGVSYSQFNFSIDQNQ